jgi:hypothetical protein
MITTNQFLNCKGGFNLLIMQRNVIEQYTVPQLILTVKLSTNYVLIYVILYVANKYDKY